MGPHAYGTIAMSLSLPCIEPHCPKPLRVVDHAAPSALSTPEPSMPPHCPMVSAGWELLFVSSKPPRPPTPPPSWFHRCAVVHGAPPAIVCTRNGQVATVLCSALVGTAHLLVLGQTATVGLLQPSRALPRAHARLPWTPRQHRCRCATASTDALLPLFMLYFSGGRKGEKGY